MSRTKALLTALLSFPLRTVAALAQPHVFPSCAPGGTFDLSQWELHLPTGTPGHPTIIPNASLAGCAGYQDAFFFTEPNDGALVMKVPGSPAGSGCITTPHGRYCRTELREIGPAASWDPNAARNRLRASLAVVQVDNGQRGTVVAQVHMGLPDTIATPSKPVCELYYSSTGELVVGVERSREGPAGRQTYTSLGTRPVGSPFSFEIRYEGGRLSVGLDVDAKGGGGPFRTLPTFDLNAPPSYFRVGNVDQGSLPSDVHFFSIQLYH